MVSYRIKVKTNSEGSRYYPQYRGFLPSISVTGSLEGIEVLLGIFVTVITCGLIWLIWIVHAYISWEHFTIHRYNINKVVFDSEEEATDFVHEFKEQAKETSKQVAVNNEKKKTRYINL